MSLCMDEICRTCMGSARILIPIWPLDKYRTREEEETYSIIKKLELFTTIDVSSAFNQWEIVKKIDTIYSKISCFQATKGDGLPEKLCITCINEFQRMFLFKQKCEKSDSTLRAYLKKNSTTKTSTASPQAFSKEQDTSSLIENVDPLQGELEQEDPGPGGHTLQCSVCLTGFDTDAQLKIHLLDDHATIQCKEEIIDETCTGVDDGCGTFENVIIMNQNELTVKDEVEEDEQNDNLELSSARDSSTHFTSNTHTDPTFQCDICKKMFGKKTLLKQHIKRCHITSKRYECKSCPLCK